MMHSTSLLLARLIIVGYGRIVYDEKFHAGVNIIRGKNSSGKSTITDMIFYVLGGENVEWTTEAISCDYVYGEFIVSGLTLSLRREISLDAPSISVCEGKLSDTFNSQFGWSVYGRMRSESKESFSQFMFNQLGLPQTKSDDAQINVTMHQVLRLIYADQNTDCTSIFRREKQTFADRQDIRRSVGEMLLGIDDLRGHDLRLQYITAAKSLAQKQSRLDSLVETAIKTDPDFNLAQYAELIGNAQEKQKIIELTIEDLSVKSNTDNIGRDDENERIKELDRLINQHNYAIADENKSIQSLAMNLADSEVFIESLESDLEGLMSANKSQELIGEVKLLYCPICLAILPETEAGHCPLCKENFTGDAITGGRLRYEQEIKYQIKESKQIFEKKQALLKHHQNQLKLETIRRDDVLSEHRTLVNPTTHVDARVIKLLKEYGYLTRLIEDLTLLESIKDEVALLETDVQHNKSILDAIDKELKRRRGAQEERRKYCQETISDMTINILHEDIVDSNNDTLSDATGLIFSFEKDFLSVRHGRLSASTQAFLKNSFYLALLQFAVKDEQCRLPSFFILDNIEDKGMVPERFRKFHHLLIHYSETVATTHQVILTTSYIDEELENSKYCIGPSYDRPPFTLNMKEKW